MSRKWERMVSKNSKKINKDRSKKGIAPISTDPDRPEVFKGRSIMLALFFILISIFLLATLTKTDGDTMYWYTTSAYLVVGVFIYFVRRPYLKVSKTSLSKRGLARELVLTPSHIKEIVYSPGQVIIDLNGKSPRWVYTKTLNRFDVAAMAGRLKKFAEQNQISFVDKTV
ncbi:methyltransferase [Paenibacillus alba]|uniref:Methyltransferase n=1 Tax=Paenibacillus alba TaxID=1197127 RepID=A0ABU6GEI1_9BACL|nr:methyltransferase [Paenibacillus alba]MEC0231084.1 methyltransferase [Paenibacillus alba]NQX65238.1 methyltransferase [Paenibacillus alba]